MSRSYKKYPSAGNNDKFYKKYFNKKTRKIPLDENLNGGRYKKFQLKWYIMEGKGFRCVSWKDFKEGKELPEEELKVLYHRWFLKK